MERVNRICIMQFEVESISCGLYPMHDFTVLF